MKRGDLILVREPNTPAGKARPYVVITRDSALHHPVKVTGCPLTSQLRGAAGERPIIVPTAENGLRSVSEIQTDWIYTHSIDRIDGIIGRVEPSVMTAVDEAVRRWIAV